MYGNYCYINIENFPQKFSPCKIQFFIKFQHQIYFLHNNNKFLKFATYHIIKGRKNHSRSNPDPPTNHFAKALKNRRSHWICIKYISLLYYRIMLSSIIFFISLKRGIQSWLWSRCSNEARYAVRWTDTELILERYTRTLLKLTRWRKLPGKYAATHF